MSNEVYWQSQVPVRDDFGFPVVASFIDGKTTMGPWAIMTLQSHRSYGVGLGLGKGQKYQRQDDNRWLKVDG